METDVNMEAEHIPLIEDPAIEELARAHPGVIADLKKLEPVETAATLASFLAAPELQANCIRLEALVHLAVAYCEGQTAPTREFVRQNFERLGDGYCGMMEDPAEDLFVTLVNTPRGNFRIFEGIREGAGFYLQRILDIVEGMPDRAPFKRIRDSVECLLKLSDTVAARAGVIENCLGHEMPLATMPTELAGRLSPGSVRFSEEDLATLQIPKESLTDFVFSLDGRSQLQAQTMGHTDLERRPIVFAAGAFHLLLPTAVASAITRLVIEMVISMGLADTFELALSRDFGKLFHQTPILGKRPGKPIPFQRIPSGWVAGMMTEADPGRFLHFVFFVDGLDGFPKDGLNGANADPESLSAALRWHLDRASTEARKQTAFRDGITLFVSCGFGRELRFELTGGLPHHWRLESIAAYDLMTLNWLSEFDALSLWRLLDSKEAVEGQGLSLLNMNGLLNLVAWSRQLGGHLVPHGALPDGFVRAGSQSTLVVRQNAIRDLRHSVMTEWNPRRVLDPEGCWVKVRKLDKSEFEEDNLAPLYGSEEDVQQGRLRGVYVAPRRPWWIEIAAPELAPREPVYQHWMMLCAWLSRAAPILDEAYAVLPPVPVSFHVAFEEIVGVTTGPVRPKNADELRSLLQVFAEVGSPTVRINVGKGFDDGFSQPENFAERALVEAFVAGAATAAGEAAAVNKRAELLNRICPSSEARWIHRFQAQFFRDYVGAEIAGSPTLIDPLDDAASRIGLGWKIRSRDSSPEISGIRECTSYLNDIVKVVLDDLCALLQGLDRRSLVTDIILNHETAAHDRDVWKRSARANLGLHDDKEATVRAILEHHGQLNVCFLASRILLEAAICECPPGGGRTPGRIDLSRAMALAVQAHHYGGWSDAVHWGAIEPRVRITPLGDVHIKHDFIDTVYEPFGRALGQEFVKQDTDSYSELYTQVEVPSSVATVLDRQFLDAWQAEFGVSLDGIRAFLDQLDHIDRQPVRALISMPRSALVGMLAASAGISLANALTTLNTLTLTPRPKWRVVSDEFTNKDWFPWRFRRRLSVLRRPFIQVDNEDDPTIVVAPGLVRDAVYATTRSFHSGEIPSSQARSSEMRRWIGHANNIQRIEFNSKVALRMRELGWQANPEVKLTEILGRRLDQDYGDVDVLAWRPESGRVLVMECKNLAFHKTLREVAEQLADFRGEARSDGKPDHLKRHLNRLEVLAAHKHDLSKALKLPAPIHMEGHLVFKNPVPMRFGWERMAKRIQLSLFAELDRL